MKKKVAFFAEILIPDFDGASRTMHQLIDRIPKDQFQFYFFCGVPPNSEHGLNIFKVPAVRIPYNETYKVAFPYFHTKKIYEALDQFDPDIIHIASPSPLGNVAIRYAKKQNIPVVGIYHTHFISYVDYYFRKIKTLLPLVKPLVVKGQRKFYGNFDKIFVPTQQIIKELDAYGFETNTMQLWQRGMNHSVFNPSKKNIETIRSITKNDHPTVIFASRLVWEKNLETLAAIYFLSKKQKLGYNFIIAGDGVAKEALQQLMPDAYFLGTVDHEKLAQLYATSDVFVFPSDTETYGNVVVEAMACGCPCVIAKGGGSQSHVTDGVNGYLCPTNDAAAYLEKISAIINTPSLAQKFAKNGITYTLDLDWDKLCNTYFKTIAHMVSTTKGMIT